MVSFCVVLVVMLHRRNLLSTEEGAIDVRVFVRALSHGGSRLHTMHHDRFQRPAADEDPEKGSRASLRYAMRCDDVYPFAIVACLSHVSPTRVGATCFRVEMSCC